MFGVFLKYHSHFKKVHFSEKHKNHNIGVFFTQKTAQNSSKRGCFKRFGNANDNQTVHGDCEKAGNQALFIHGLAVMCKWEPAKQVVGWFITCTVSLSMKKQSAGYHHSHKSCSQTLWVMTKLTTEYTLISRFLDGLLKVYRTCTHCFPYKTRTFNRAQICTNFKNIYRALDKNDSFLKSVI